MKKKLFLIVGMIAFIISCKVENSNDYQPSNQPTVDHKSSVEMEIHITHDSMFDVFHTQKKVWHNNNLITINHHDTIPKLDSTVVESIKIRPAYDIFITVK